MKKINNKILAIGLLALVGIFVLTKVFRSPKLESNVRKELVNLDRTRITEVRIEGADSSVILLKENNNWTVGRNDVKLDADSATVERMLQTLQLIEASRMASRKKEKWAEYKVDSTGTSVSVFLGGDKEAEFVVGNVGFTQNAPYTYVRLSDEDEVYVVDGFLGAMVPTGLSDWKSKK
jgi:hypothetical protein